jgi:poly-beta-1,6-N-acetyl-D-glucosamine synthase
MSDFFYPIYYYLTSVFADHRLLVFVLIFFPCVIIIELPYNVISVIYVVRGWLRIRYGEEPPKDYYPLVSILITAYSESKEELEITIISILEQIYHGRIELLFIIDNAAENKETFINARKMSKLYGNIPGRDIKIIAKQSRGGHASSMNLGLKLAKGEVLFALDADTSIDNQTVSTAVRHFKNPNVIALSGGLRVRNFKDSLITRLQAIEYIIGIQLGRFGLTELNVINNISGAFGIFRRKFLLQIGGWLNGTAEDMDLLLRIHAYTKRYPQLKIIHEPEIVGWTAVPVTFRKLMKQRLRWDGDLYYIYVTRHWRLFSSKLMGKVKTFFVAWYGLYFQLALPFIVLLYTIILLIKYNLAVVIAISILIYGYYLIVLIMMFLLFLLVVSERPKQDVLLFPWLFLMPFYQQIMRISAAFFILNEIIFKGHNDTSMAPWWVIRKTK